MRILIGVIFLLMSAPLFARQVPGRPTLPSDCTADEHWVQNFARDSGPVTAHCRKSPNGYEFWVSRLHQGRPRDWPLKTEKSRTWEPEALEAVLDALGEIPSELWLKTIKGIYRMKKSVDAQNLASSGSGHVILYDLAFQKSHELRRVLTHELAHERFRNYSDTERLDYGYSTGWGTYKTAKGRRIFTPRKCCYVESDGQISPGEDFANNVEYFLLKPEALKRETPNAYTWIQKHFSGSFKLGGHGEPK